MQLATEQKVAWWPDGRQPIAEGIVKKFDGKRVELVLTKILSDSKEHAHLAPKQRLSVLRKNLRPAAE